MFAGVIAAEPEAIDPYELIEAVDILSKLPKDFFENLVSVFADRELQWNVSFNLATWNYDLWGRIKEKYFICCLPNFH